MRIRRRTLLTGLGLGVVTPLVGVVPALAKNDVAVRGLIDTLARAKSYKVRMHAAALLGRYSDGAAFAALALASRVDPEASVRAIAVRLLGDNKGGDLAGYQARAAIARATTDKANVVRVAAEGAMRALRSHVRPAPAPSAAAPATDTRITIALRNFGGEVPSDLREFVRGQVRGHLLRAGKISVVEVRQGQPRFILDGNIKTLSVSRRPRDLEVTAAVDLVLSRPSRGILMVASGEAIVQKERLSVRNNRQERHHMMQEAAEHAALSAHENLKPFLSRHT